MKIKQLSAMLLLAGIVTSPAVFAASDAERIVNLEKQLKALQEQIQELKKNSNESLRKEVAGLRDQMAEATKENVVVGDIPGSYRIPGTDSSVRVYGIAELNMVHEFKGSNSKNDYSTFLPYVPLNGTSKRTGETYVHARTSRIGIEGATPSPYGQVGVKIEGDFNNDPRTGTSAVTGSYDNILTQQATNSYNFRLRHAYLQVGPNWLFGQTWSTFMDIDNTPETVDFNGPIGSTFIRQPMIRYTYTTPNHGNFTAAVENSIGYVIDSTAYPTVKAFSRVPDLVARWDKSFDWGSLSLRGVTHELRLKDDNTDLSRRGYGLAASGQIKTVGDDYFTWIVTGGKGIGRYFNYIEGAAYDGNNIVLEKAIGVVLGYQHKYSDTVRLNFVYGTQKNFNNEYTQWAGAVLPNDINKKLTQIHIGGFWNPIKPVEIGLEYIYGRREALSGEKGDMSRVNFLARYNLN